jgi:hypothetical protein
MIVCLDAFHQNGQILRWLLVWHMYKASNVTDVHSKNSGGALFFGHSFMVAWKMGSTVIWDGSLMTSDASVSLFYAM